MGKLAGGLREGKMARSSPERKRAKQVAPRPSKQPDKTTYRGRLAHNLRKRREDLGLSVAEVEARLEAAGTPISLHALYKYETSERPVTADDLPALAKALETTIHKLVPAK